MLTIELRDGQPIYKQIRDALREKILSGELAAGLKLPPDIEMGRMLGVSTVTLRDAYAGLMREGYISRRPRKGTVVSDKIPFPGAFSSSRDIGIVFDEIFSTFNQYVAGSLNEIKLVADAAGYGLNIFTTRKRRIFDVNNLLDNSIKKRDIAGLILLSPVIEDDVHYLMKSGCPFVVVGNDYLNLDVPTVLSEDHAVAYDLTSQMIAKGHTNIALVCSQRLPLDRSIERGADRMLRGYRSAIREHDLSGRGIVINFGPDKVGPGIADMDNDSRKMLLAATAIIMVGGDLACAVTGFLQEANPGKRPALAAYVDEGSCDFLAETVDILVERSPRQTNRNAAVRLVHMIGDGCAGKKCLSN